MRAPTAGELEAMKREVATAMEAGCLGLTTGLRYDPQSYAETEEVIELAKVAAEYGGFYTSHIRDEGDRGDPVGAIEEIIRIGREAGRRVSMSPPTSTPTGPAAPARAPGSPSGPTRGALRPWPRGSWTRRWHLKSRRGWWPRWRTGAAPRRP